MIDFELTYSDFRRWLKLNKQFRLRDYSPDEVYYLARLVGFSPVVITSVLSNFADALQGSSIDNRATSYVEAETYTIEMMSGKLDLYPQWQKLYDKVWHGTDFDE